VGGVDPSTHSVRSARRLIRPASSISTHQRNVREDCTQYTQTSLECVEDGVCKRCKHVHVHVQGRVSLGPAR
jgi:hypothetical protein